MPLPLIPVLAKLLGAGAAKHGAAKHVASRVAKPTHKHSGSAAERFVKDQIKDKIKDSAKDAIKDEFRKKKDDNRKKKS